ncbi:MAG: hypothetical protein KF894_27760 [Labilithrix sp.]|nr:hypothetical protein [Labilithrix sp.]
MRWGGGGFRLALVTALAAAWAREASASPRQARDYFLDPPQKGLWAHGDAFTLGAQASLESRTPIEDETFGTLALRASALASIGFSEAAAHVDVRYLLFTFGASAGYRNVWRTYQGAPGTPVSRALRLDTDRDSSFDARAWRWGEGRGRLVIPLDRLWFVTNHALRWEGSPENTYDWFHTNVHDGGVLYRGDAVLFVRSASLGALGPYARYMDMPRGGRRRGELAAGLFYGIRPGLKQRDDLLSVVVLARPGDDEFGFHVLRLPLWTMVLYRASFRLLDYGP